MDWTPPAGMLPAVVKSWRAFYLEALSGRAGYRIMPEEYRRLYLAQKGRCWICRKAVGIHPDDPKGRGSRRLGVDHDHLTGDVRGLLCTGSLSADTCNRLIARYSRQALARAAEYMATPPARVLAVVRDLDAPAAEKDALALAYLWPKVDD
jgi:hypothetical protein